MKIPMIKMFSAIYPDASTLDEFSTLKDGEYMVEIKKTRNLDFHKKYFALLNLVFMNQDRYTSIDNMRHAIMIETGYFRKYHTLEGELIKEPDSIALHKMDQVEFEVLYQKTIDAIFRYLIVGTKEDEQRFVEQLMRF
jgi:hypothetical protein